MSKVSCANQPCLSILCLCHFHIDWLISSFSSMLWPSCVWRNNLYFLTPFLFFWVKGVQCIELGAEMHDLTLLWICLTRKFYYVTVATCRFIILWTLLRELVEAKVLNSKRLVCFCEELFAVGLLTVSCYILSSGLELTEVKFYQKQWFSTSLLAKLKALLWEFKVEPNMCTCPQLTVDVMKPRV